MSVESDVYDLILTALTTQFPAKTRIPNPYSLKDNSEKFIQDGYGIKVGAQSFEPFEFNSLSVKRSFIVVLTVECVKLDSDTTPTDDRAKVLMDDVKAIQKILFAMDGNNTVIDKVDLGSASAVETVDGMPNILVMEAEFNFQIRDSLT